VATLSLMCEPTDIGQALDDASQPDEPSDTANAQTAPEAGAVPPGMAGFDATAYLFDNVPGGVGLAERIYERAESLLERVAELVAGCRCSLGCPSCVGVAATDVGLGASPVTRRSPASSGGRKRATLRLLEALGFGPRTRRAQ
jgi:DEAD/DEAH box helicase domain-containing protein